MALSNPTIRFVIENGFCGICGMQFKLQNPYALEAMEAVDLHLESYRHQDALNLRLLQAESYIPSTQTQTNSSTHTLQNDSNEEEKLSDEKHTKIMNKVIIFNFDDTLFPSTKLKDILERTTKCYKYQRKILEPIMTTEEENAFHKMSTITYNLLTQYIEKYSAENIFIISASKPGWIKLALSMVYNIGEYSKIYDLLSNEDISIYQPSCDKFEEMMDNLMFIQEGVDHPSCDPALSWKYDAFKIIFDQKAKISDDETINEFVIIGHSASEYEAAEEFEESIKNQYGENENIIIDRIKLDLELTVDGLLKQQIFLYELCGTKYDEMHPLQHQKIDQEEEDDKLSYDMVDID